MKKFFATCAVLLCVSNAHAAVVDFEDLTLGGCAYYGKSVQSRGFSFTGNPEDSDMFGCPAGLVAKNTSNALINANKTSMVFMTKVGGGSFDLTSFEAGNRNDYAATYGSALGIDVLGFLNGGGTVSQRITFNGDEFGLFTLNDGFRNLDSVTFTTVSGVTGSSASGEFVIDNIDTSPRASQLPEPATLSLFGLGAIGVAALRRRRGAAGEQRR